MQSLPSFDDLKEMAEHDPKALEALRISMSQEIIDSASESMKPKLQAQLSHINRLIAYGKNPNHINMLLRKELMQQFGRFATALNDPAALTERTASITSLDSKRDKPANASEVPPVTQPTQWS